MQVVIRMWLSIQFSLCSDRDNDWDDHSVETKHLGENKEKDEGYKNVFIDSEVFYSLLTNNSNSVTSEDIAETTD